MSFVAISKVSFPSDLKDRIEAVGLQMIPIAKTQSGFISIALHQSLDRNETMMCWEWESKADHENCMKSNSWSELMNNNQSLFRAEGVEFSIDIYNKLS